MNATLRAALDYAALGWPVFPLAWPLPGGGCACGHLDCSRIGKHPLGLAVPNGKDDATTDAYQLAAWWRRWPHANLALATGPASGVWVLDLDGQAGRDNLHRLIEQRGDWRRTVAAVSGGGGWHLFWKYPEGRQPRSTLVKGWPGVDVRGHGGSCTLAPSLHASGQRYRWCRAPGQHALAEAPGWLLDLVDPPKPERVALPPVAIDGDRGARYGRAALERAVREVEQAGNGQRNCTLNNVALSLGHLIPPGYLDYHETAAALEASAVAIGLDEREAAATIRSGLQAGQREPRYLAAS